ncbi:hypothetical protein Unana1_03116 [Umbelopsis nana]
MKEQRTLNIYLPPSYAKNTTSNYPVIYLLDGSPNEDFIHIVGIAQFLNMIEVLPESIVVGIANVDRIRDMTFPTTIEADQKAYPTEGHSKTFMEFIGKEVQPFVQKHYRTTKSKTLIGQSLGGLVATEMLLKKPGLFSTHIIVSPSLWWSNEELLALAPGLLKSTPPVKRKVWLTVGTEPSPMANDTAKLAEILKTSGSKNIDLTFTPLPEENHLTILHNAVYKAFQALYAKN